MTAGQFINQVIATDPGFARFQFSAIAASVDRSPFPPGNICSPPPLYQPVAAAAGIVYQQLSALRDGAFFDLCLQDFDPAWPEIADAIAIFLDGFESL